MKKKKIHAIILMILIHLPSWGQVSISIDSIELNGVIEVKENDIIVSNFGYGPNLTMSISITNESPVMLTIAEHFDYQLYCEYEYDGIICKTVDLFLSINKENGYFSIPQDGTYCESISTNLFLPYETVKLDDVIICNHVSKLKEVLSSIVLVLKINGRRYVSNNKPIIKKGDSFFLEYKWIDN